MGLQEEKLDLQQSFDGKEILLRAADGLLLCFLFSVFKAQRLSFLISAVVQCKNLFMLSLFLCSKYSYRKCGLPESCETILYLSV